MKWYEVAAAGALTVAVLLLVVAGLGEKRQSSRTRLAHADSRDNVTLVGPPTIHEHALRTAR